MEENGFDLTADVAIQGWNMYFDRLLDPVFPILVKELWIHATSSNHQVTSYVIGKNIAITKDMIAKLIGYNGRGIRCNDMAEKCSDLTTISREIFTSGQPSNKIKHLKDYFRIWAKTIMGCINHGKPTSSPDYINIDQQFLLYFIATKAKVNLPHLLFNHLRTSVKETREDERTKRDWTPLGRLISDILTENKLVEYLTETQ